MKLKHRNLEQIRQSPQIALELSKESRQGGKSMVRYWDWAVGKYHKTNSLNEGLKYLQNGISSFNDNKKNRNHGEVLIKKLIAYSKSYEKLKYNYVSSGSKLNMEVEHNNYVTGEIFRIDKTDDQDYAITLMNRNDEFWAHELRFKLLQIHFSNINKCPFDSIRVGVFNFIKEDHEYFSFSDEDLKQAWSEIIELSGKINKLIL